MEDDSRQFPNRLRLHRKNMRYTQKQAAALLGLHPCHLSQWETGAKMPSAFNLLKLSAIYRTLPNELYFDYFQKFKDHLKVKEWELFGNGYHVHK